MYAMERKYSEAQPIYARLAELEEKAFGHQSVVLAHTLDGYPRIKLDPRKMAIEIRTTIFQQGTPHSDPLLVVHRASQMLQASYVSTLR
jgi:hypothetical protein